MGKLTAPVVRLDAGGYKSASGSFWAFYSELEMSRVDDRLLELPNIAFSLLVFVWTLPSPSQKRWSKKGA